MKEWNGTPESIFKQIGASNHTKDKREENDFYATNPKAIDDLLKRESFSNHIWECACGLGHLSERLKEHKFNVYATDIIIRNNCIDEKIDFLNNSIKWDGDIITNPPYKYVTEFIQTALSKIEKSHKIAFFLKLTTLEGAERYNKIYKYNPPKKLYVYVKRIQCAKNGIFKVSSAVCYAWFIWEKDYKGKTEIEWIYE